MHIYPRANNLNRAKINYRFFRDFHGFYWISKRFFRGGFRGMAKKPVGKLGFSRKTLGLQKNNYART